MQLFVENLSAKISFFCFLVVGIGIQPLVAQPKHNLSQRYGKLTGTVHSTETGKPIIGASVWVVSTTAGDATDLNGHFTIKKVQPGLHSIVVSYLGYAKKTISHIKIKPGQSTNLHIVLQPKTTTIEGVTITENVSSSTESGLLTQRRQAAGMQDGLSAQYLGKVDFSNVATAMTSIPGVTLVNNNEVFIRGLGSRYTNIQLNGASVPSTSATQEKAPIDLIGGNLIDHITIKKTYTPSKPAEFAGGTVQIVTREFPDQRHLEISYSTRIQSTSIFNKTLTYNASRTDFVGYDDGMRQLPGILRSHRLTEKNEDIAIQHFPIIGRVNHNQRAIPSQKISLRYADQYNENHMPIGLVSSFTYQYNRDLKTNQTLRTARSYIANNNTFLLRSNYTKNAGIEEVKLGDMLNLFIKPSSSTKIGWKNLYSNSLNNRTQVIQGHYFNYLSTTRQTIYDFDRRALLSSVLTFEKYIRSFHHSKLTVTANYSRAVRKRPDRRTTQYNRNRAGNYLIYFDDAGNSHYYSNQVDHNYTGTIDFKIDPTSFLTLKVGTSAQYKNRNFDARRFEYRNFGRQFPDSLLNAPPSVALNPKLVINDKLDLRETTTPRDSYTGTQHLFAGYISTIWKPLDNFKIQLGVRVEDSDMNVTILKNNQTQPIANVENTDILPATNITYSITPSLKLKGAFSLTLSRPNFREISNFRFQDFIGGQTIYGNPNLRQTQIQNYDLRLEYYPNPGELLAISGFYKHFDNPIALFYRFTEAVEVQYRNADRAVVYGLEISARKNITPHFRIVANGSYIYSQAVVKKGDRFAVANPKRPMYGQSPYTLNIGLFYGIPGTHLDATLNYHTFGKRLIRVGKRAQGFDEYEQAFHSLNAGLSYQWGHATISANIKNILGDDIVHKQYNLTTFRFEPGRTYKMSISFSL